jgi:hypothetical protein
MEGNGKCQKKFTAFYGIGMLITTFTNIPTVPYAEPDESTLNPPILLVRIHFNITLSSAHTFLQRISLLHILRLNTARVSYLFSAFYVSCPLITVQCFRSTR